MSRRKHAWDALWDGDGYNAAAQIGVERAVVEDFASAVCERLAALESIGETSDNVMAVFMVGLMIRELLDERDRWVGQVA